MALRRKETQEIRDFLEVHKHELARVSDIVRNLFESTRPERNFTLEPIGGEFCDGFVLPFVDKVLDSQLKVKHLMEAHEIITFNIKEKR